MRSKLRNSTVPADVNFCTKLDQLRYGQWKPLVLLYAAGRPEWAGEDRRCQNLSRYTTVVCRASGLAELVAARSELDEFVRCGNRLQF
jgi:hypothetical protein